MKPLLTVLSFSAGKQSTCLLEMVLRKEIEKPLHFVVLNADPGMENSNSYKLVKEMKARCDDAKIHFETVKGPNLYKELIALNEGKVKRIDNPPYWTKDEKGKIGRLMQKCTYRFKIAPMDRAVRRILYERFRFGRKGAGIPPATVEKWIGFTVNETHRVKEPSSKYQVFRYPLIDKGMTNDDVHKYFIDRGILVPDRSVCNGCFANGLRMFKEMRDNRPEDFAQAVAVDEAVRHGMAKCGVRDTVYVSSTGISLKVLSDMDFNLGNVIEQDKHSCQSGYCFT